jgi:hypothetical protein
MSDHEQLELNQPLEILRSTARRLMERQIPASANKLEEMYAHLKGAVGDSIDQVSTHIARALTLTQENLPQEVAPDSEAGLVVEQAQLLLSEVQDELQLALSEVKESFFAANSFQECEARLPNLALFESRLEKNLLRLEQAVSMVDDPELFGLSTYIPSPTIPEALEALAEGLDLIHAHLQAGHKEPLRLALEAVQKAQRGLSAALVDE